MKRDDARARAIGPPRRPAAARRSRVAVFAGGLEFRSFFVNRRQGYKVGRPRKPASRIFAEIAAQTPPGQKRTGGASRDSSKETHPMSLAAPHAARTLAAALGVCLALAGANAAAKTAKPADKDATPPAAKPALVATYGDWSVFQSQAGKEPHLLCARPAQGSRPRRPQTRSRLRLHFRATRGRRAQRSLLHHGLRGGGPADASEPKDKKTPDARTRTRRRRSNDRADRGGRRGDVSIFCPRAPISG